MQKRTALAATALLLGAQFALVQNSRGHGHVRLHTLDTEGSGPLSEEIRNGHGRNGAYEILPFAETPGSEIGAAR